MSEIFEEY
jgi:homoserine acetyltransferase